MEVHLFVSMKRLPRLLLVFFRLSFTCYIIDTQTIQLLKSCYFVTTPKGM